MLSRKVFKNKAFGLQYSRYMKEFVRGFQYEEFFRFDRWLPNMELNEPFRTAMKNKSFSEPFSMN